MPDFTVHPLANTQIPSAAVAEHFQKIAAFKDRVHSGYTIITSPSSLSVTVQPGVAYVSGRQVGKTGDVSAAEVLTANATNHLYLKSDGNLEVNVTGVAPADSIKLWEIVTNASGTSSTTDRRSFVVDIDATVRVAALQVGVNGPAFTESSLSLKGNQPYVRLEDTNGGGITARIYSKDGYVKITNDAGSVDGLILDVANKKLAVTSVGPTIAQQHTLPAVASDTVVLVAATQTLTAKTLTDPRINSIKDTNGVTVIALNAVASAVNNLQVSNNTTGNDVQVAAQGSDTNISLNLIPKGTGIIKAGGVEVVTLTGTQTLTNKTLTSPRVNQLLDTDGDVALSISPATGTAVNYITVANSATGSGPTLHAAGSDTNIALKLRGKGTGHVYVNDGADASKQMGFNISGATTGLISLLAWPFTAARTLTLPDATDTLVGKATTDTFTNKTFNTAGTGNVFQINGTGITAVTGTGSVVLATSPTLVTPNLGTPSAVVLTNGTGLPISTGVSGLGTGIATFLATPSSANLRSAITDETGTGALVFAASPTITDPIIVNISPGADFTLTQNSVAVITSVNAGAVASTLYLQLGNVGLGLAPTSAYKLYVGGTAAPGVGVNGALHYVEGTLTKAASSNHPVFAASFLQPPTISGGAATVSVGATLYVNGAPTGATSNYAMYVISGLSRFDGNVTVGAALDANVSFKVQRDFTMGVGSDAYSVFFSGGTLTKAGSGTHGTVATLGISPITLGAAAATVTNAATVYISNAPSGATNNMALWVGAGATRIDGQLILRSDTNAIVYQSADGNARMLVGLRQDLTGNVNDFVFTRNGSGSGHWKFSNGSVQILSGVTNSLAPFGQFDVINDSSVDVYFSRASGDQFGPQLWLQKARGTHGGYVIVQNNDIIGGINSRAYNGSAWNQTAYISFQVDGTPTSGQAPPTRIQFYTNNPNASPQEQMRIDRDGLVIVYSTGSKGGFIVSPTTIGVSDASGHLYIPKCAGVPSSTPSQGNGALILDSTNNRVYCYSSGSWRALN